MRLVLCGSHVCVITTKKNKHVFALLLERFIFIWVLVPHFCTYCGRTIDSIPAMLRTRRLRWCWGAY